jgi:molybdopterin/thiamine biosynthesis adenylyltransferase
MNSENQNPLNSETSQAQKGVEGSVPGRKSGIFDYDAAFSRNLGLVQPEEQLRLKNSLIAVAGLGGVGGVHLTTLARLGISRFHVADFDQFELQNFNRQTGAGVDSLGRDKVDVMVERALRINPDLEIQKFSNGVTKENVDAFLDGVDVVVDGLDFFAQEARATLYDAAERHKIPLVTAGPIGMSVAWLIFEPGGMGWRDYFRLDLAKTPLDKILLFALGLTPRATQLSYLDPRSVDLSGHRGPSLSLSVQLCAGVAAGETLKLILNRGRRAPAPSYHQFDVYMGRYVTGKLRWGNSGWLQRLRFLIARRWLSQGKKGR